MRLEQLSADRHQYRTYDNGGCDAEREAERQGQQRAEQDL